MTSKVYYTDGWDGYLTLASVVIVKNEMDHLHFKMCSGNPIIIVLLGMFTGHGYYDYSSGATCTVLQLLLRV